MVHRLRKPIVLVYDIVLAMIRLVLIKPSCLRFEPSLLMSMRYDEDDVNLRQS